MTQEYVVIHEPALAESKLHEALVQCDTCTKIVPKTMLCLYCGAPILYREPQEE
jgi:rRNA maturation endonuclease Nob1